MIVQKFGGIAMQSETMRQHSIHHINNALKKYNKIVIVVSAIGRSGDPYATDSLISLTNAFSVSPIAKDLIASCGEIIAASVLSAELQHFGIENEILHGKNAGIITKGEFGNATIADINPISIWESLKKRDCIIIPGFQGMTLDGQIMTLGRGGSDLTAVALAEVLQASHVEFFKDVPGILTEDPKKTTTYEKLDFLTFEELLNLIHSNHPIIQKRAVHLAKEKAIPLYVRGIANEEAGTWITK